MSVSLGGGQDDLVTSALSPGFMPFLYSTIKLNFIHLKESGLNAFNHLEAIRLSSFDNEGIFQMNVIYLVRFPSSSSQAGSPEVHLSCHHSYHSRIRAWFCWWSPSSH